MVKVWLGLGTKMAVLVKDHGLVWVKIICFSYGSNVNYMVQVGE